jgi:transcription elongation factor
VVGVTGPNGFRAHAWLQGDPVPAADDPAIEASVLQVSRGEGSRKPADGANGTREVGGDGAAPLTSFNELLRRPAPRYPRD